MPLELMGSLPLSALWTYDQTAEYWKEVHAQIVDRMRDITERDVKDYDAETKKALIANLTDLRKTLKIDDMPEVRLLELDMSLKLLTSNFLEKRIRGLNEIKEAMEDSARYRGQSYYWGMPKGAYLDINQIMDWLLERNVLEVLTGERAHAELLKRSVEVFEIMAKKKKWTPAHLKILWDSTQGKHESYVRCAFDILARMPACLSPQETQSLFDTITQGSPDPDEKYLTLLKDFTLSAINSFTRRGLAADDYGILILYSLAIDQGNEFAGTCLTELLGECKWGEKIETYAEKALRQFLAGEAVPQSLELALSLIENMKDFDQGDFFHKMNKKAQPSLSIQVAISICRYEEAARLQDLREEAQKSAHSKHLSLRFRLLALLTQRGYKLDSPSFESLWSALVARPAIETDTSRLFSWLVEAVSRKSLDADHVLSDFLSPDTFVMTKATVESFNAFRGVFLQVNYKASQLLDVRGSSIIKRYGIELRGFEGALSFALDAESAKVNSLAVALVVDCMVLLAQDLRPATVWGEFTVQMVSILQGQPGPRVVRALQLCHALIDQKVDVGTFQSTAPRTTFYISLPRAQPEKVAIPSDAPLSFLRRRVAVILRTHPSRVQLKASRLLDFSDDDQPVSKVILYTNYVYAEVIRAGVEEVKANELLATDGMYESLFSLAAEPATTELAWELLTKLPSSKALKRQLEQMSAAAFEPQVSFHKRLYSLILICELCQAPSYADSFLTSKDGQKLIKSVFETNLVECSGLLVVKFTEVVCQLVTKLVKRHIGRMETRMVLHRAVNYLYCLALKQVKGCETAVLEVRKLLEACFTEEELPVYAACFATHAKIKDVLLHGLVRAESPETRHALSDFVLFFSRSPYSFSQLFLQKLLDLLRTALDGPTSLHYFSTVSKLVRLSGESFSEVLHQSLSQLMESLHRRGEKSSQEADEGLQGGLYLVRSIVKSLSLACSSRDLEFVMKDCLFSLQPLCKHQTTRKNALKLLGQMIAHSADSLSSVLPEVMKLYIHPGWRSGRTADWEISSDAGERSTAGFVGIRNPGCICYMISVLQQLFMVKSFRSQIMGLDVSEHDKVADNLLYVCQRIFAGLGYSAKQYIGIQRLCEALKDSSSIHVNEQMDVEEFLNAFMDIVEGRLGPNRAIISSHFGGLLATEIIGRQACTHTSERVEQFLTLPLEVKNKKSVQGSLESLVLGETLEGDNAYQCDQCGARVTAQRRQGIRHLPNILLLALRRFDYDYDARRRLKINDLYEFPWELDLEPYTIEGLHKRDVVNEGESVHENPRDYYQYRLRGIVIHMGSAEGGHYYCFIQDRGSSKWYEFNDTLVREVDQGDIPSEAYGGQEQFNIPSAYGDVTEVQEKVSSAYLLLYERAGQYAMPDATDRETKKITLATDVPESDSTKTLIEEVMERNRRFWCRKTAFAHEFVDFVLELARRDSSDLQVAKLVISYFLTVVVRAKDRYNLHCFVPQIEKMVKERVDVAEWIVEVMSVPEVVQELLLVCPHSFIRRIIISLVKPAVRLVDPAHKARALERVLALLMKAKSSQHHTEYFHLLYLLAHEQTDLPSLELSQRLIKCIMGQSVLPLQPTDCDQSDAMLGYGGDFVPPEKHFTPSSASKNPSISYALTILSECQLTEDEKDIILSKEFVQECLRQIEGKTGAREAGRLYYPLIRDDEDSGRLLLSILLTAVHEGGKEAKQLSLRIIANLLSHEDDTFATARVVTVMTDLPARMKAASNLRERSVIELVGPFLYKLCLHNEHACLWVTENWRAFSWLEDWVRRWSYPTYYGADSLDTAMAKKLRSLASGRVKADTQEWDSDEDIVFAKDTHLRVYKAITDTYEYMTITDVLGDIARGKVEARDNAVVWIESDSEEARPIR